MSLGQRGVSTRSRDPLFPAGRDLAFTNYGITAFETIVRTESLSGATVALPAMMCEIAFVEVFDRYDLDPLFLDVDPDSFHVDPEAARAEAEAADVLLLVHAFGAPADVDAWGRFAEEHDVMLVEDCARALGATYDGRPVGSFGRYGFFSLRKVAPVMRGGALVGDLAGRDLGLKQPTFDPKDLYPLVPDRVKDVVRRGAERVASEETLDRDFTRSEQLDPTNRLLFELYRRYRLSGVLERNHSMAGRLIDAFERTNVEPQSVRPGDPHHYLAATVPSDRDELVRRFREAGVPCEILWDRPWADQFVEGELAGEFPNTGYLAEHVFQLPLYRMSTSDARRAVEVVDEWGRRSARRDGVRTDETVRRDAG